MSASLPFVNVTPLTLRPPVRPAWMEGLRVQLSDQGSYSLQHLGHLTFTVRNAWIEPYEVIPATFTVDDTLSLTAMVMAYPRDAQATGQVFSFVEADPDILACVTGGRDHGDIHPS